jgi:hypothetical protein
MHALPQATKSRFETEISAITLAVILSVPTLSSTNKKWGQLPYSGFNS